MEISRRNFFLWASGAIITVGLTNNLGCSEEIKTFEETEDRAAIETENQLKNNDKLVYINKAHEGIIAVQLNHLHSIGNVKVPQEDKINDCLREGQFLFSAEMMELDTTLFLIILEDICKAMNEAVPGSPDDLLNLSAAEEFKEENLKAFINDIALMSKTEMQKYIAERDLDTRSGLDRELIAFVLFMSLAPFYRVYRDKVGDIKDFSLWRQGYCPVCGQVAVNARHRIEDRARVLFCWLCHAEWLFPRLECPYCGNNDQNKLRYFYVSDDKTRQVHVCEKCKRYLKTVNGKFLEKDMLLDVEEIATGYLDVIAKSEGYKRPTLSAYCTDVNS